MHDRKRRLRVNFQYYNYYFCYYNYYYYYYYYHYLKKYIVSIVSYNDKRMSSLKERILGDKYRLLLPLIIYCYHCQYLFIFIIVTFAYNYNYNNNYYYSYQGRFVTYYNYYYNYYYGGCIITNLVVFIRNLGISVVTFCTWLYY